MPRDLEAMAKEKALDDMPQLTKSPEDMDDKDQRGPLDTGDDDFQRGGGLLFSQLAQRNEKRDELHPYTQTLSLSDLESCVRLEEEAFPPHERATREKVSLQVLSYALALRRTDWLQHATTPVTVILSASPQRLVCRRSFSCTVGT